MTIAGRGPLLFLDVDGPLIPFGGTPQQYPEGYPTYRAASGPRTAAAHPLLTRINPANGPRLAALGCELVWATTWMADANECVAPWLGLPPLPVMAWPEDSAEDDAAGLHWKTRALVDRTWPGMATREERVMQPHPAWRTTLLQACACNS